MPMHGWQNSLAAVPLGVLGALLGLASSLGEWSRVVLREGTTAPAWRLLGLGPFGFVYALALVAMLAVVAVALFGGERGSSRGLRVAGLVLAGLSLALVGAVADTLAGNHWFGALYYRVNSSYDQDQVLGWGTYAAFGAFTALAAALLACSPVRLRPEAVADGTKVK